jgi:hypothetical protein
MAAMRRALHFSLEGTDYEIDLNAAHVKALRRALHKYIEAGPQGQPCGQTGEPPWPGTRDGPNSSSEVRALARRQGIKVSDRGRIPSDVIARFKEETGA